MRLIDADALHERVQETIEEGLIYSDMTIPEFIHALVNEMPTIDAEPIKHGRWIYIRGNENIGLGLYECSECHKGDIHAKEREVPYCWNCGAEMRGDSDEA